jgi:predicted RNA-binding protein with PUA-like domain
MGKNYWLVKQEPEDYSWAQFQKDKRTAWTGVRNFEARNNLRAMKSGDVALYYHSGSEKQVVGIARVTREAYPDPTAEEGDWVAVDLEPVKPLAVPVSLAAIKADKLLKEMPLARKSRLSVSPVTSEQFERLTRLAE